MDELCHPFKSAKGYLCHNGHWFQGAFAARMLAGHWSDSKVAAHWLALHGWKSFCKEATQGVWLYLVRRGCAVHYKGGALKVEINTGALCSEACPDWGEWVQAAQGTYNPGAKIPEAKFTPVFMNRVTHSDYFNVPGLR